MHGLLSPLFRGCHYFIVINCFVLQKRVGYYVAIFYHMIYKYLYDEIRNGRTLCRVFSKTKVKRSENISNILACSILNTKFIYHDTIYNVFFSRFTSTEI